MSRWLANIVALILIIGLVFGLVYVARQRQQAALHIEQTSDAVDRIELTLKVQAATGATDVNARGWPLTVDPAWFNELLPRNMLLAGERPWMEIALPEQAGLRHPPVRQAIDESVAEFWYNPALGIVRARVPLTVSDEQALTLYNRINGAQLASIFEVEAAARLDARSRTKGTSGAGGGQAAAPEAGTATTASASGTKRGS